MESDHSSVWQLSEKEASPSAVKEAEQKHKEENDWRYFGIAWLSYTAKAVNAPRPSWMYFQYRLLELVSHTEIMSNFIH